MSAAEVHVWWARIEDLTDAYRGLLDERERERWARYQRRDDRDRFALGSAVVRILVAELDGADPKRICLDRTCPQCGAQHGPVTTPDRTWRCSVSHSGPFALAAVVAASASTLLGVDLETTCPTDWRDLLAGVLTPAEVAPEHEQEFLTLWVRKEAVVKATGDGLSRPMSSVRLSGPSEPPLVIGGAPALRLIDLDVRPLQATRSGEAADAAMAAAVAVGAEPVHLHWQRARI